MIPAVSFSGLLWPAIAMLIGIGFVTILTIGTCVLVPRVRESRKYETKKVGTPAPVAWGY